MKQRVTAVRVERRQEGAGSLTKKKDIRSMSDAEIDKLFKTPRRSVRKRAWDEIKKERANGSRVEPGCGGIVDLNKGRI